MAITQRCPRCGGILEVLRTYSHCVSCFYFEDYWSDADTANLQALREAKQMTSYEENEICNSLEAANDDKECA